VILKRKPLVLSPQTIGPFFETGLPLVCVRRHAQMCGRGARDDKSLVVARQMAPDANNLLSVDVAFVLPFTNQASRRGSARPQVGLNVSGLLMEEALSGRNRFGLSYDYAAFSRQLITALQERGFKVHLVPHATSKAVPEDDDGRFIDLLAAEFPEAIRVADFANPSDAKTYLSGLDFVVAARMHCCIGAFSAGVPVVPISYQQEVRRLVWYAGLSLGCANHRARPDWDGSIRSGGLRQKASPRRIDRAGYERRRAAAGRLPGGAPQGISLQPGSACAMSTRFADTGRESCGAIFVPAAGCVPGLRLRRLRWRPAPLALLVLAKRHRSMSRPRPRFDQACPGSVVAPWTGDGTCTLTGAVPMHDRIFDQRRASLQRLLGRCCFGSRAPRNFVRRCRQGPACRCRSGATDGQRHDLVARCCRHCRGGWLALRFLVAAG